MWHIAGAGALGALWGSTMARAGHGVRLVLRRPAGAAECCVTVTDETAPNGAAASTVTRVPVDDGTGPIHRLLVLTKAYHASAAVAAAAPRLAEAATVVVLSNGGLALAEELRLPPGCSGGRLVFGETTHGAYLAGREDGARPSRAVVHATRGATHVGGGDAAVAAALGASLDADVAARLWRKLALNACANPLTALLSCRTDALAAHAPGRRLVRPVLAELRAVAHASGVGDARLGVPDGGGLDAFATGIEDTLSRYGGNVSSMLADVQAARPTEVDYLNGWVARRGAALGVPTPVNAALADLVRLGAGLAPGEVWR